MTNRKWPWVLLFGGIFIISGFLFLAGIIMLAVAVEEDRHGDVFVVELKGQILDSQEMVRELEELGKKDEVKAVVVRIDSPGGLVAPSQEIYSSLVRLREKKQVVVSVGTLAAAHKGASGHQCPGRFIPRSI